MKTVSIALICALFYFTLVSSYSTGLDVEEGDKCDVEDELTPHHECDKYYHCALGEQVVRTCSENTYFNPDVGYCDFPENVPACVGGTRPPIGPPPTTQPPTEVTQPPSEETQPPTEITQPPSEETQPPTEVTQPPSEETQPPTEVTQPPSEETQPPTEVTQPPSEETQPPTEVTQSPSEETQPPTEVTQPTEVTDYPTTEYSLCSEPGVYKIPYPNNCSLYILCADHEPITQFCPEHTFYDPEKQECNVADLVPGCAEAPLCDANSIVYKPIPGNCTAYVICVYGDVFPAYCPEGTLFDPVVLQCNIACKVDCTDSSVGEPTPCPTSSYLLPMDYLNNEDDGFKYFDW